MGELLDENNKILIVGVDNVQSQQVHNIRIALRGKAQMLMGKNTMMSKVLLDRVAKGGERDKLLYQKLVQDKLLQGNVGLVFTNGDLSEIRNIIESEKVQAPAKQGSVAPCDVVVPAGNTGLEPTKTTFFQALNIGTKIVKGTVEILKDEKIITHGHKVSSSEAALLQMLGIKPFWYGLNIFHVYDNGSVYGPAVLSMTDADMREKVSSGISNLAALSLALGIPTKASLPHVILNAFKDILSISVGTDYEFNEFNGKDLKQSVLHGPKPGTAAPAASSGAKPAEPAKKAVEEEEEEETAAFGLFD